MDTTHLPPLVGMIFCAALLLSACTTLQLDRSGVYDEDIGTATSHDIVEKAPQILRNQYNYEIRRLEHSQRHNEVLLESEWKRDRPAPDEEPDVTSIRTQIVIEGRPRVRTGGGASQVSVLKLNVEKQVRRIDGEGWERAAFTEHEERWITELHDRLREDIVEGIRTY